MLHCRVADVKHIDDPFFDREQDPIRAPLLSIEELTNGFVKGVVLGCGGAALRMCFECVDGFEQLVEPAVRGRRRL